MPPASYHGGACPIMSVMSAGRARQHNAALSDTGLAPLRPIGDEGGLIGGASVQDLSGGTSEQAPPEEAIND